MSKIEQRSEEWFASRLGRVGASRVADIMATTKSGPSSSRKNYMAELLCERLMGERQEGFTSVAIQWGIDHEDEARDAYELETGNIVTRCAGFPHPTIPMSGASPDGLIGDDGDLEIKCPNTATHLAFIESRAIDLRYQWQMVWQLACSLRKWADFVSYDPRLPGNLSICIVRFVPPRSMIDDAEREVKAFVEELDELEKRMRERMEA
jgi:putative phage-type endonuclease